MRALRSTVVEALICIWYVLASPFFASKSLFASTLHFPGLFYALMVQGDPRYSTENCYPAKVHAVASNRTVTIRAHIL